LWSQFKAGSVAMMMRACGVVGPMVGRGGMVSARVAVVVARRGGVAVVMAPRMAVAGLAMVAMPAVGGVAVAAMAALPVMGGVGGGGHRGVPGHVIGIVERVRGIAIGIVLGGGGAGDGEEDAGEGGQLGEGEFHGHSLED
jgi:hypothetical protein